MCSKLLTSFNIFSSVLQGDCAWRLQQWIALSIVMSVTTKSASSLLTNFLNAQSDGGMMLLLLVDNGPNGAYRNIQELSNQAVTYAIPVLLNNLVAQVEAYNHKAVIVVIDWNGVIFLATLP